MIDDKWTFLNEAKIKKVSFLELNSTFCELDFSITEKEINECIVSYLKPNKAAGPDGIISEMLKASGKCLIKCLRKLFNSILLSSHYPSEWSKGIISYIHKGDDIDDPNNYRGITLTSHLAKLFNSILNERLNKFLKENEIISESQIGFKKECRTSDHIFIVNTIMKMNKKNKKNTYLCFIDFKKAFDSILHNVLFEKLLEYNISGLFYKVIKSMYKQASSSIIGNQVITQDFPCLIGT